MSATSDIAGLPSRMVLTRPQSPAEPVRRTSLTLLSFGLLGTYGLLRWGTMLQGPPDGRLVGFFVLSMGVAWVGLTLRAPERPAGTRALAGVAMAIGVLAVLPMSGLPLSWFLSLRFALIVHTIGHGLNNLPTVIVPYAGFEPATTDVITLGAGVLLALGALVLAAARGPVGQLRLAAAALPLVVLSTVPSALARPQLAYLHGALLFALLVLFVFSERIAPRRGSGAATLAVLVALTALVVAPSIGRRQPWISFQRIAGVLAPNGESFDWSQTYGPLVWPRSGSTVLDVRARFPTYWKAEDLDVFNGQGWVSEPVSDGNALGTISAYNVARWSEQLTVTLREMSSYDVIAAGVANPPTLPRGQVVQPGTSAGTYVSANPLEPGESYRVAVYAPTPTPEQLAAAGQNYPLPALAPELQVQLPAVSSGTSAPLIQFASYGTGIGPQGGAQVKAALLASPYAPAYELASRLAAGTSSPYEYVEAVLRYLAHGFTYTESPPVSRYPILTFLFGNREGYCQQFAGAMALLLRMGGVPARVAAGFATGTYDRTTHEYVVTDLDAHAWVEAWFPGIGWVKFDPTPSSDPALGGSVTPGGSATADQPAHRGLLPGGKAAKAGGAATVKRRLREPGSAGGGFPVALVVTLVVLLLLAAPAALWLRRRRGRRGRGPKPELLLVELERAFAWCGRPLAPDVTLAALEARFADVPAAAGYVRTLREARFAGASEVPDPAGRVAVRSRLARGLGPLGRLRALVALPPRPARPKAPRWRLH